MDDRNTQYVSDSKMSVQIKFDWVQALRSEKYSQTRHFLEHNEYGNCCLGVLCRVAKIESTIAGNIHAFDGQQYALSYAIMNKIGIGDKDQNTLIIMNDEGSSFAEIADFIEKNVGVS